MTDSSPPRRPKSPNRAPISAALVGEQRHDYDVYVADESERSLLPDNHEDQNADQTTTDNHLNEDAAHDHPPTGYFRTLVNFIKGNLGTGILAVPDAIRNAGLVFGSVVLVLIGLLATYCCHLLLRAYRQVSSDKARSYAQVIDLVFRGASSPRLKRLARPAGIIINTVLVSAQIGYCSVYILFCSRMIKEVVDNYQADDHRFGIWFYQTVLTAFLVPYCFVTTLSLLSIFSTLANIVSIGCIVIVMQYVFQHLKPIDEVKLLPTDLQTLPLFFGTAMFTFESISLILPIENRMKDRRRFHGWNGLLSVSMFCIISLYTTIGFFGYLAFGDETKMILSNMPNQLVYQLAKLLYAFCIVISFNLQVYVPVQILLPSLQRLIKRGWFDRFGEYIFRTCIVLFTYLLALNIPCLEHMISLFGAFASSWLALIIPPTVEFVSCFHPGQEHCRTIWLYIRTTVIVSFGLFGCVLGTVMSIKSIITALSSGGCSTS